MRIHLSLNGIFSYFRTRRLTLEEMDNWDNYPIVSITPDGDAWDPNAEHFREQEAAMLNSEGMIIERKERPPKHIFTEADIGMPTGMLPMLDATDPNDWAFKLATICVCVVSVGYLAHNPRIVTRIVELRVIIIVYFSLYK